MALCFVPLNKRQVLFLLRPWQFINLHEIVGKTVNIAQSHKPSYTDCLKKQIYENPSQLFF